MLLFDYLKHTDFEEMSKFSNYNVKLHLPIASIKIEVVYSSVPTFCTMLDSFIVMTVQQINLS